MCHGVDFFIPPNKPGGLLRQGFTSDTLLKGSVKHTHQCVVRHRIAHIKLNLVSMYISIERQIHTR